MITYQDSDLQKGINRNKEIFDIALQAGVLKKAGSWYKLIRPDEETARYWEAVQAGLDPEDEDFASDAQDIAITDDELDKVQELARELFPNSIVGKDDLELTL